MLLTRKASFFPRPGSLGFEVDTVEGVKDCLYQDHSLADQLTGAFKIVKDAGGVVRVVFQASSDAAAEQGVVRDRLLRLLQARWRGEIAVEGDDDAIPETPGGWQP